MRYLTFREFRRLSGLSDPALLALLEGNRISLDVDEELGIVIDIDTLTDNKLIAAICSKRDEEQSAEDALLIETAARVIRAELDELLNEVIRKIEALKVS